MEEPPGIEGRRENPIHEILVKGLPLNVTEFQLSQAFGDTAPVLDFRIFDDDEDVTSKVAYLKYSTEELAEQAARSHTEFGGRPISVEVVKPHPYMCIPPSPPMLKFPLVVPDDTDDPLMLMVKKMREHPCPKAFYASCLESAIRKISGLDIGRPLSDDEVDSERQSMAVLKPDMLDYLDGFPHCKALLTEIRSIPNNDNKTPNSVLDEYVKKMKLRVEYETVGDLSVSPFKVLCRVTSNDGTEYAHGCGEAPSKKVAKQKAAAETIEMLLKIVDEEVFLPSDKNRMPGNNPRSRHSGRGGRGYSSTGRYRGKYGGAGDSSRYPGC